MRLDYQILLISSPLNVLAGSALCSSLKAIAGCFAQGKRFCDTYSNFTLRQATEFVNNFGRSKKTSHEMRHNQPTKTILRAGVEPATYGFLRIPLQSTALPTELSKVVEKKTNNDENFALFCNGNGNRHAGFHVTSIPCSTRYRVNQSISARFYLFPKRS